MCLSIPVLLNLYMFIRLWFSLTGFGARAMFWLKKTLLMMQEDLAISLGCRGFVGLRAFDSEVGRATTRCGECFAIETRGCETVVVFPGLITTVEGIWIRDGAIICEITSVSFPW